MHISIIKEIYLTISLAMIIGAYWPWAEINDFALRPFTEGIAVWLILGLAPVAMAEWLMGSCHVAWRSSKALARKHFCTYP